MKLPSKKTFFTFLVKEAPFILLLLLLFFTPFGSYLQEKGQWLALHTGLFNKKINPTKNYGKASYNIKLKDIDGNVINLHPYKNQTIFINFWATWCGPCRAEMPSIQAFYKKLATKSETQVFLISKNEPIEKLRKFLTANNYDIPIYTLLSPLPEPFAHNAIPTTFVVDKTGNIVFKHEGIGKYDTEAFLSFFDN